MQPNLPAENKNNSSKERQICDKLFWNNILMMTLSYMKLCNVFI